MTPDGLTLYVTFSDESCDLLTFRGTRSDTGSIFGGREHLQQFDLDLGFATTAVTGDDCEVFGWVSDNSGNNQLRHAVRGGKLALVVAEQRGETEVELTANQANDALELGGPYAAP